MNLGIRGAVRQCAVLPNHTASADFDDRFHLELANPGRVGISVMEPAEFTLVNDPEARHAQLAVSGPSVEDDDLLTDLDEGQVDQYVGHTKAYEDRCADGQLSQFVFLRLPAAPGRVSQATLQQRGLG